MKKILIISMLFFCFRYTEAQIRRNPVITGTTDTAGVTTASPEAGTPRNTLRMARELNLTREQLMRLKAIRLDIQARQQALENDPALSETDRKSRLLALRQERMESNRKILSAEQQTRIQAFREARRQNRPKTGPL
ncbi:MAG: hypothetical protein IPP31_14270 [Chitinophagaceae bacterium]|nr:hypothetical protein [Chitinophagaceae bacterium]